MQLIPMLVSDVSEEEVYRRCAIQRAIDDYFAFGRHSLTPTKADFDAWWPSLPGDLAGVARFRGFAGAWQNRSFQRFVLESRGYSLHEHLAEALDDVAYAEWLTYRAQGTGPDPNDWNYSGRKDPIPPTPRPPLVWKWFLTADGSNSN